MEDIRSLIGLPIAQLLQRLLILFVHGGIVEFPLLPRTVESHINGKLRGETLSAIHVDLHLILVLLLPLLEQLVSAVLLLLAEY